MGRFARWFLYGVLGIDLVFAAMVMTGSVSNLGAQSSSKVDTAAAAGEVADEDKQSVWTRDALVALGSELSKRTAEIEQRELELEELARGTELLDRLADLKPGTESEPGPAAAVASAESQKPRDSFLRLQKAFENMEPESAAQALIKLAAKDKDAAVALVLGWPARTSGAILDAVTQLNPALAADLSYSIWRMDGKDKPQAANSSR